MRQVKCLSDENTLPSIEQFKIWKSFVCWESYIAFIKSVSRESYVADTFSGQEKFGENSRVNVNELLLSDSLHRN